MMNVMLTPRQCEVAREALLTYAETLQASLREGTYSAINSERVEIARAILALLRRISPK